MKTDVQLKDDILAELKWPPDVHETDVGVIVKSPCVATCTRGPSVRLHKALPGPPRASAAWSMH